MSSTNQPVLPGTTDTSGPDCVGVEHLIATSSNNQHKEVENLDLYDYDDVAVVSHIRHELEAIGGETIVPLKNVEAKDADATRANESKETTMLSNIKEYRSTNFSPSSSEASSVTSSSGSGVRLKKKKKYFPRSVFHFVPGRFIKSHRKWSKRSNRRQNASTCFSPNAAKVKQIRFQDRLPRTLGECRQLPLNISLPSNFVHVASGTSQKLVPPSNDPKVTITYQEKCAMLLLLDGKCKRPPVIKREIDRVSDDSTSSGRPKELRTSRDSTTNSYNIPRGNRSFLWNYSLERFRISVPETNRKLIENDQVTGPDTNAEELYDDVLRPLNNSSSEVSDEDYDDVEYPESTITTDRLLSEVDGTTDVPQEDNSDSDIYDDVIATGVPSDLKGHEVTLEEESSNRDSLSSPRKKFIEDDPYYYDDILLSYEERVNSLYGGSSRLPDSARDDVQYQSEDESNEYIVSEYHPRTYSKRLQHRQQRSRRSRRSSCSQNLVRDPVSESSTSVAVSLGYGSILLIGQHGNTKEERRRELEDQDDKSQVAMNHLIPAMTAEKIKKKQKILKNPVQIRVIDLNEDTNTQEISCYICEEDESSDGSVYESLDFHEERNDYVNSVMTAIDSRIGEPAKPYFNEKKGTEAPTKPVPPPPRERSLTESLGRRIKMLRRTWSITKGTIGRVRARTSPDLEYVGKGRNSLGSSRHFRASSILSRGISTTAASNLDNLTQKSPQSPTLNSQSTFYLDCEFESLHRTANGTPMSVVQSMKSIDHQKSRSEPTLEHENTYVNWTQCKELDTVSHREDSVSLSSKTSFPDHDHYSNLTEHEPLYQFYAAAAARGSFDTDSDTGFLSNSEIDNKEDEYRCQQPKAPLTTATMKLAGPGRRTLWYQTSEVIDSGLLSQLTPEERKIQEAKFEILTSEASYLNSLRVLRTEFTQDAVLTERVLSPAERRKLFGFVPEVIEASEKFLADLESVWKMDPMLRALPEVLLKHTNTTFDVYVTYCSNQVSIDSTLKDLRTKKDCDFIDVVSRIEARPSCHSLSLHSFLMLPMQRITRLPLLADAVLSKLPMEHPEWHHWESILSSLSHIVAKCNEAARVAAQEVETELLARKLVYKEKVEPIPLKGKHVIKSGSVVQLLMKHDAEYKLIFTKRFTKSSLYLILLTDYLLIGKRKASSNEEAYLITDTCKRSLIAMERMPDDPSMASMRNAMILTLLENHSGRQAQYFITCESSTERERWLEAVSPLDRRQGIGETLYEAWDCPQVVALYSYVPCQSDELQLHPGEVINVLRKMPDGWYQGEKLLNGELGWFPGNFTKEIVSEHVRARNLKQRHRFLVLSENKALYRGKHLL